jgi:tRNA threonylcarbamoyladenosine biosynthesis protein TsaE
MRKIARLVVITKSPAQTEKLGEILAKEVLKMKRGIVLALEGDLGGGKTTFLKGFARGLKIKEKILSPTFILMRRFEIKNRKIKNFYHFDCYRIENEKEILNLGFKKIIFLPKNLVAVEWAEKIRKILPKNVFLIKFKILGEKKREISLGYGK